ncbi:MAG: beta-hexosaminidase [Clostridiales bacterium]|nr:beta-hexosaminidase [Clostridiales bacterium]
MPEVLIRRLAIALILLFVGGGVSACAFSTADTEASDLTATDPVSSVTVTQSSKMSPATENETIPTGTEPDSPVDPAILLARDILLRMTPEQKVGQMFFATWVSGDISEAVNQWNFGGIVLFAPDFEHVTPEQFRENMIEYQTASDIPMLIGVDEEGGTVVRVSRFSQFRPERFMSPQALFEEGGIRAVRDDTIEKSRFLLDLGINVNLAPVCDISTDTGDFIHKRSFGRGAEETAVYVTAVVEEMNRAGIGCTLKHFPGYGNNIDTHTGIAEDRRGYDEFVASDFLPFEAGIAAGAGSVMVSHNIVYCMDEDLPASLSPNVHRILREDLEFQGVIMTDDLSMDAIKDYTGDQESAVLAVLAGNDMIIGSAYAQQIPAVIAAVQSGEIDPAVIDEAVMRILLWKIELGIIEQT